MCYIVFAPRGTTVKASWFIRAYHYNPNGFGLAYFDSDRLFRYKTLNFSKFLKRVQTISPSTDRLIHMRYATRGRVCLRNVQPIISPGRAVAHNGTIPGFGNKDISDSVEFCRLVLDRLSLEEIRFYRQEIESEIPWSKFVVLEKGDFLILNENLGAWYQGTWHSTTMFL